MGGPGHRQLPPLPIDDGYLTGQAIPLRPPASYAGSRTSRVASVSVYLDGVILRISANP